MRSAPPRPYQRLSGEGLPTHSRRADANLSRVIDRLRAKDPKFHQALKLALALDDEAAAGKNRP
jgi:hypothetical protein